MIFFLIIPCGILAWAFAIAKAAGMDMSWWFCLSPIWLPVGGVFLWMALDKLVNRE